jgi:hypothetical protein
VAVPARSVFPHGPARRPTGTVGRLMIAAVVLAGLACVSGPPVNYVLLAFATCALAAAGAMALVLQWSAAVPATVGVPVPEPAQAAQQLAERLRRLRRSHLEQVDRALDAGRPDLARELSDAYTDRALRILTDGTADAPR